MSGPGDPAVQSRHNPGRCPCGGATKWPLGVAIRTSTSPPNWKIAKRAADDEQGQDEDQEQEAAGAHGPQRLGEGSAARRISAASLLSDCLLMPRPIRRGAKSLRTPNGPLTCRLGSRERVMAERYDDQDRGLAGAAVDHGGDRRGRRADRPSADRRASITATPFPVWKQAATSLHRHRHRLLPADRRAAPLDLVDRLCARLGRGDRARRLVHRPVQPAFRDIFEFPFLSGIFAVLIAAPLFQTVRDEGAWRFPYARLHRHAWTDAVIGAASLVFTGITFLLAWLIAGLFDVIGIDVIKELLQEEWFGWMLAGFAFGGAVGILRERDALVATLQKLVMVVLAVLAPVLAVALAAFLAVAAVHRPQGPVGIRHSGDADAAAVGRRRDPARQCGDRRRRATSAARTSGCGGRRLLLIALHPAAGDLRRAVDGPADRPVWLDPGAHLGRGRGRHRDRLWRWSPGGRSFKGRTGLRRSAAPAADQAGDRPVRPCPVPRAADRRFRRDQRAVAARPASRAARSRPRNSTGRRWPSTSGRRAASGWPRSRSPARPKQRKLAKAALDSKNRYDAWRGDRERRTSKSRLDQKLRILSPDIAVTDDAASPS